MHMSNILISGINCFILRYGSILEIVTITEFHQYHVVLRSVQNMHLNLPVFNVQ